jgi:hypothetical protein
MPEVDKRGRCEEIRQVENFPSAEKRHGLSHSVIVFLKLAGLFLVLRDSSVVW